MPLKGINRTILLGFSWPNLQNIALEVIENGGATLAGTAPPMFLLAFGKRQHLALHQQARCKNRILSIPEQGHLYRDTLDLGSWQQKVS